MCEYLQVCERGAGESARACVRACERLCFLHASRYARVLFGCVTRATHGHNLRTHECARVRSSWIHILGAVSETRVLIGVTVHIISLSPSIGIFYC